MSLKYIIPENKAFIPWVVSGVEAYLIIKSLKKSYNKKISERNMNRTRKAVRQ